MQGLITLSLDYSKSLQASAPVLFLPTHTTPRFMWNHETCLLKSCMGPHDLQRKKMYIFKVSHNLTLTYLLAISPLFPSKSSRLSLHPLKLCLLSVLGLLWSHMFPRVSNRSLCKNKRYVWEVWIYSKSQNQHIFMLKRLLAIRWLKSLILEIRILICSVR